MANTEHLKILKQGVEVWNKWRDDNNEIRPDLDEADLSGLDLGDFKGNYAKLRRANLQKTYLNRAEFYEADLSEANLSGANLRKAYFHYANLHKANLSEADVIEGFLANANLSCADLSGTQLQRAKMYYANLRDADLSWANLSSADLTNSKFQNAVLTQVYLISADLGNTNFSGAILRNADIRKANLNRANLSKADLNSVKLMNADLSEANLIEADLFNANLSRANLFVANLSEANLNRANLSEANLRGTDLSEANLSDADLEKTNFVETRLEGADLSNSHIYGISAWNLKTNKETKQLNLVITQKDEPAITVDNIEVAQFVYLMLNRKKLRNVINTITSKSVLILGRFTPERKAVLDAMANELRNHNLLPIIFDFERASSRDFTETIKTLAGMSLFVIADITNPSSAPLELQALVPDYQIPFVPIIQEGEKPFAMFRDLKTKYSWVLPILPYSSSEILIKIFKKAIIDEAFEMHKKLLKSKAGAMETRSAEDYLKESE